MKKNLLLIFCLLMITSYAWSQSPAAGGQFSVGLETGFPDGSASANYWIAIGGSLKYERPVNPDLSVSISAGYTDFNYTKAIKATIRAWGGDGSGDNFVPIKVGLKHYFNADDPGFFAEMQAGGAISTEKHAGTAFIFAAGAGYEFGSGFEAGIRYEGWFKDNWVGNSGINQIGIRLGYNF